MHEAERDPVVGGVVSAARSESNVMNLQVAAPRAARGLAEIPRLRWHPTSGAYYAFMRVEGCTDSVALAWDLLERAHLAVVPGSIFGRNGEGYLRLSYGSVEQSALEEACGRLDRYFKTAHP